MFKFGHSKHHNCRIINAMQDIHLINIRLLAAREQQQIFIATSTVQNLEIKKCIEKYTYTKRISTVLLISYTIYNQYNIYPQSPIVHRLNGNTKVDRENGNSRIMIFLFIL